MPSPPSPQQPIRLTIRGYTAPHQLQGTRAPAGRRFLQVEVTLENTGSEQAIPSGWRSFSLSALTGTTHTAERSEATANPCTETTLALRANRSCSLAFELAADARPASLSYDSGAKMYTASFDGITGPPSLCSEPAAEDNPGACNDGCNNDGDPYLDCDDADCCAVRADCPSGTYCGGAPTDCTAGPEATVDRCQDACDNEGNDAFDCADPGCCDLVACGADTFCGQQPDPFAGGVPFDDARIASIDPSSLRAGASPCRAPVLVNVDYVNDGDTMEVSGALEGLVRFIGVDTPEVGRDGTPSQCFAEEARAFSQQLRGHLVWLTFDAECNDRFGRHLAYVHVGGRSPDLFQRQLLRRGFARSLTVSPNDTHSELFRHDEGLASSAGIGLWAACR